MVSFIPGSVILYRESGSGLPLWPAIYCTDDIAPKPFLRTRPSTYVTLILKLARVLDASQLRWAKTSELNQFDPFTADEGTKQSTPGLADAYDVALAALESGLNLDHWKTVLSTQYHDAIVIDSNDETDDDEEMRQMRLAIQRSITDYHALEAPTMPKRAGAFVPHPYDHELSLPPRRRNQRPSKLRTPTPSPSRRANTFESLLQPSKRPSTPSSAYLNDELASPWRRRKLSGNSESSKRADPDCFSLQSSQSTITPMNVFSDDDDHFSQPSRQRKSCTANGLKPLRHLSQHLARRPKDPASSGLSAKQVFLRNGLNASTSAVPDNDVIEDLNQSSQFVQVFVGPEVDPASDTNVDPHRRRHKLQLLKHHVWERPYFRNALSGRNYFEPIGDNTWELVHPRLVDIATEDFRMVAEFLSDGDFGIRNPEDEEQVAETFAECISAWKTAELLSMDDLLEHIVAKIRAAQPWWDLWNVMAFACSIYQSEVSLQTHDELKALFSEYIADLFYIYLEDDHLSGTFLTRLKQLPELERDIFTKRAEQLNRRLQPQEGFAVQEEEEGNDMDLYT